MFRIVTLLISALLMMFLGIYIIISPSDFLAVVVSIFALYIIFDGIRGIVSSIRFRALPGNIRIPVLSKGIINTLLGAVLVFLAVSRSDSLPSFFIYIVAVDFLLTGIVNLFDYVMLSRQGIRIGTLGIETVLAFVLALLLFIFPSITATVVFSISGAVIFSAGVVMAYAVISGMINRKKLDDAAKMTEQKHTDVYDD